MSKRVLRAEGAARPLGAYSQGWRAGDFVFVTGTGPIGPDGKVAGESIEEQTEKTIDNIEIDRKSTSELQSHSELVCRLLLAKKNPRVWREDPVAETDV